MRHIIFAAGFVGKNGGDIRLLTQDRQEALAWTRNNKSPGRLAVMRGFDQEAYDWGASYMESILVNDVIGYDGRYTNGYLHQLDLERAA